MTSSAVLGRRRTTSFRSFHDLYFAGVLCAVAAYAIFGKGFAYAGVPPIFPAETILAIGLVTLAWPRASLAAICSLPHLILLALMAWAAFRTVPFIAVYKLAALRDSVVVFYGLFAMVVTNLILEKPERIDDAVYYAGRFFSLYGCIALPLYFLQAEVGSAMPNWPGSPDSGLVSLRAGEIATHLGGAAVFAMVGLKRNSTPWICCLLICIVGICALSRGGMMAIVVPVLLAVLLTGRFVPLMMTGLVALPLVAVLYFSQAEIKVPSVERSIQVDQLIDNTISIFGSTDAQTLDDTKKWRLRWWDKIVEYTIDGDYFWTGKGFGINLALSDGIPTGGNNPLRSPHSVHMTMLARMGIPGLVIWIAFNVSWLFMMLRSYLIARMNGDKQWANLIVFVTCYAMGALVDASFDVALEGPMIGVVFWVLIGAGTGLSMTYRARVKRTGPAIAWRGRSTQLRGDFDDRLKGT